MTWATGLGPLIGGVALLVGSTTFGVVAIAASMLLASDHTPGMIGFFLIVLGFAANILIILPFFVGFNLLREALHFATRNEWPDGLWTITRDRNTTKSPTTLWIEHLAARYAARR